LSRETVDRCSKNPLYDSYLEIPKDLLNRTQSVVEVSDVSTALALARQWQQQGRAEWFRGQVFPWALHSSLKRWTEKMKTEDTLDTEPALDGFYDWARKRPEILKQVSKSSLKQDPAESSPDDDLLSALTAIAQHFGVPTNYIDFSFSPEVAALFSRDRLRGSTYPSDTACILSEPR
jgi:FRG domain